jgi:hypothetical protein
MTTEIASLFNATDPLTVTFPNGGKLQIIYKRMEVTSGLIDPSSTDQNVLATAIASVVTSWDATWHGNAVDPTDAAAVGALPLVFLQIVLKAIIQDQVIDPS